MRSRSVDKILLQVRLVVEDMVKEGLMFPGQDLELLRYFLLLLASYLPPRRQPGTFPTSFLSEIEADGVSRSKMTREAGEGLEQL